MKLVLLSGGSGKRLWPLSNDARSKQFLRVLENDQGELESMVQRVWRQLNQVDLAEETLIATGEHQVEILEHQLNHQAKLIVEPERRDTFAAIALSASYLYSIEGVSLQSIVGVLPVDPYVEDHFFTKVTELEEVMKNTEADLGLIGVTPTYPSSKYGYILPKVGGDANLIQVGQFKEKPTEEVAKILIGQGGLWNSGVFAFKLGYIISLLMEKGLPIHYEELMKRYAQLPKNSFDYEVVEKAENIAAIPYDGFWKDLGTWNTLTEEMGTFVTGNGQSSEDSTNTHLINELDIPITVIGIKDAVVAACPDGILVADKQKSPLVKKFLNNQSERVRYMEKSWGTTRTLESIQYEQHEVHTNRLSIHKDHVFESLVPSNQSEVWTIVKGQGISIKKEEERYVRTGEVIHIPSDSFHVMKAETDLEIIVVQTGRSLKEELQVETISK